MPRPKPRRSSRTLPDVGERVDHLADVVDAQPVLGDDVAQAALVGAVPRRRAALEVRQVLLGRGDGLGLVVARAMSTTPLAHLHVDRADLLGAEHAEAAALDQRRAAHADVGVRRWR